MRAAAAASAGYECWLMTAEDVDWWQSKPGTRHVPVMTRRHDNDVVLPW